MKILTITTAVLLLLAGGCKEKKQETKGTIIPVISLIKDQIAHVDTSLYTIMKITRIDSVRNDTAYIERGQFREAARDFLNLPDISTAEYNDRYTEENTYDETLGRAIFTYTAKNPEKEEVQKEELLVKPDPPNDKVTSIIITTSRITKDSSIEKKLLWTMDHSFQVTILKQLPSQPETTSTFNVVWNEKEY
jgi:hypothetical protein